MGNAANDTGIAGVSEVRSLIASNLRKEAAACERIANTARSHTLATFNRGAAHALRKEAARIEKHRGARNDDD